MKSSTQLPVLNAPPSTRERRRGFLKAIAGGAAAGAAGVIVGKPGVARASCDLNRIAIADTTEIQKGSVVDFNYPTEADPAFLTRLPSPAHRGVGDQQDIVAFLRACPHMGCHIEELNIEKSVLGPCGCHRSRFDLGRGGKQLVGRATQDLVQVTLEISRGTIYATGVVGLPYGHALVSY